MKENNPLAKIKSKDLSTNTKAEAEFVNASKDVESNAKPKQKVFSTLLDVELIERLKRYQATEAKKIETQSYILNQALEWWLDSKNFEK